nr:HD domain-containing protein [Desulfobulbaceae bacterium]
MQQDDLLHNFINSTYSGHLLSGTHSSFLKKYLSKRIRNFLEFEQFGPPVIPYISAWKEGDPHIWFEYAGRKLLSILGCSSEDCASRLRKSIVDRCVYKSPGLKPTTKEILSGSELTKSNQRLREEVKHSGELEAVYKISTAAGTMLWLKDQAVIEVFKEDNICLSHGVLSFVTKEMQAEEQLKQTQKDLRKHRDHLDKLVKLKSLELRKSQLDIISRLAKATEFRDQSTGQHITKMGHYSAIIGGKIGIKPYLNKLLFHATPMHDVGKIGISDSILLKPGKLNSQEYTMMQKHSKIGAELLSGHKSNLLTVAKHIALTHHEKWDGSGYPHGLSQKNIPLVGRIVALCDVFDALTSKRPYKDAWPFAAAIEEIIRCRGSHFDPRIVDVFLNCLPDIKKIYTKNFPPQLYSS